MCSYNLNLNSMKRFIASLLFAAVFANEDDDNKTNETEEKVDETASSVADWFSSEQTPVEWESISVGADGNCMLKGAYGGFKRVGLGQVFIRETVHSCDIAKDATVLTWAAIENPDVPGEQEGFYCSALYTAKDGNKSVAISEADVETQTGKLDYNNW